jgi:hypothetical protein
VGHFLSACWYVLVKHLPRNFAPQRPQQSMLCEVEAGEH